MTDVTDRQTPPNPFDQVLSTLRNRFDPFKLVIAAILLVLAFMVLSIARSRIVQPFDNLVTEQLCLDHGEGLERTLIDFERADRFVLSGQTDGFCSFGPGPEGEPPITLTIAETEPGPLYRLAGWTGIIVQLGIASIFLRFTVDPAFELYRAIRARLG